MFYHNTSTVLLIHEDRVKTMQKMHEPLPLSRLWRFWKKAKLQQGRGSSVDMLRARSKT